MTDDLFYFMDAHDDDEASDSVWWGMLEDSVEMFNADNGTNYDPVESVHKYIARKSIERNSK